MNLVNMKLPKREKTAEAPTVAADAPEYPYGLEIHLEKEQIGKLGLGTPKAGTELLLMARVEVRSVTVTDEKGGKGYKSMALQITDMGFSAPELDTKAIAKRLYGEKEQ